MRRGQVTIHARTPLYHAVDLYSDLAIVAAGKHDDNFEKLFENNLKIIVKALLL